MKTTMRLVAVAVMLMTCSCATTGIVRWAHQGPDVVQLRTATIRNSDGTSSDVYEPHPNGAKALRVFGMVYGILPCVVWDVVTFPVQIAIGCRPYGGD